MQKLLRVISVILITIMVTSPPAFSGGGFSNSGSSSGGFANPATENLDMGGFNITNVGAITGSNTNIAMDIPEANILFVDKDADIETAITTDAATGDTVILPAYNKTITDDIDVTVAVHIKGQGGKASGCATTITNATAGKNMFDVQLSNSTVEGLCLVSSASGSVLGIVFNKDGAIDGVTGVGVRDIHCDFNSAVASSAASCVQFDLAKGKAENLSGTIIAVESARILRIRGFSSGTSFATQVDGKDIDCIVRNSSASSNSARCVEVADAGNTSGYKTRFKLYGNNSFQGFKDGGGGAYGMQLTAADVEFYLYGSLYAFGTTDDINGAAGQTIDIYGELILENNDMTVSSATVVYHGTRRGKALWIDGGAGFGQITADGATGGCFMMRDTDDAGWSKGTLLDGVITWATDADGVC